MRLKKITLLALCLLFATVFQQVADAQGSTPAQTIPYKSSAFTARLSPDGKTLVTYQNIVILDLQKVDPTLLPMDVIDISTGKVRGQLSGFTDYASDVAFTSNGKHLISLHMNGDINVWDLASMKLLKTFQLPLVGNLPIRLLPDNKNLLVDTGGTYQRFAVIDTSSGAITKTLGTHFDSDLDLRNNYTDIAKMGDLQFASFAISPDGKLLATATVNDEVGLWTIADNQYQVVHEKSDKPQLYSIMAMTFSPNGKSLIYYNSLDKQTHIWDLASKSEKTLAIGSETFALSPDGKQIAWLNRKEATVSLVSLDAPDKATVLMTLPDNLKVAPRISWITFTPKGKQVVVGGFYASDPTTNQIYVLDVP